MFLDFLCNKGDAAHQVVDAWRGMVYRRQMQMTLASDALADVAVFRFSHIHDGGDAALEQALVSFLAMLPTDMQLRRDFTVFAAGDAIAPPVEVFLDRRSCMARGPVCTNLIIRFAGLGGLYILVMPALYHT